MEHIHMLNVDLAQTVQGENISTCTDCNQPIIIVWDGAQDGELFTPRAWSLRHEDEHDNPIGQVMITYVNQEQTV